ncbi:MAG: glutamate--cysteine ligase [Gammaproteobacteria bacterium]|nr:glutamate--cysteine ligase [Gammaproteobacteria bacterium]
MHPVFSKRISNIANSQQTGLLLNGLKGIEKESLRLTSEGLISKIPHPEALGSALTHPHITTDYSEALIELVTPAFESVSETLRFLHETHQFVYANIEDELLLSSSMPCGINGDHDVPIANYGHSNIGKMKHIYRVGLAHRYGKSMQAVSGIHFNYSIAKDFWPVFQDMEQDKTPIQDFINSSYMGLTRNIRRYSWLLGYLFGASPAFCPGFLNDRKQFLPMFRTLNAETLYRQYATSLRMSEIGYQSHAQATLNICFNKLDDYIDSLTSATQTPYPDYSSIGIKVNGSFRQLNDSILQIENEYYSPVRPKQPIRSCEKPTLALKSRGVQYIELRMLDLNMTEPLGINEQQCRFLELFILFCLLDNSPQQDTNETEDVRNNLLKVAYDGRNPHLKLSDSGRPVTLQTWVKKTVTALHELSELLDSTLNKPVYSKALSSHLNMLENPDSSLSAQIIEHLQSTGLPFSQYAIETSQQHKRFFQQQTLDNKKQSFFEHLAKDSMQLQRQKEAADSCSLDEFLEYYFNQTLEKPCV